MKTWLDADGNTLRLYWLHNGWLALKLIVGRERHTLFVPDAYCLREGYRSLYHWHRQSARMHRIALSRPARLELRA